METICTITLSLASLSKVPGNTATGRTSHNAKTAIQEGIMTTCHTLSLAHFAAAN